MTKQLGFVVGLRSFQVEQRIHRRSSGRLGPNLMRIRLPEDALASGLSVAGPMFTMEYVRKCVKLPARVWVTIGHKNIQQLCNAAAGVRQYVLEMKWNPVIMQSVIQLIKTGHLHGSQSSAVPVHASTDAAHTAPASASAANATSISPPEPAPAHKTGLEMSLEIYGGGRVCINRSKDDNPLRSVFFTWDRMVVEYHASRVRVTGWGFEAFRNATPDEIEAGIYPLVNGMLNRAEEPVEKVVVSVNTDAGAQFSRFCSEGFKSQGTAITLDMSNLRIRFDRHSFILTLEALFGPYVMAAGDVIEENILYTTEITTVMPKMLLTFEGVTKWSAMGEATGRGKCAQIVAEGFKFVNTNLTYGIRGRSEYDIDSHGKMDLQCFEFFGLPQLAAGRYGEDGGNLPFTTQPLLPVITPLHGQSATIPQLHFAKKFRLSSYNRLMTTGFTAETAWDFEMKFAFNRCRFSDDCTALSWFSGFIDLDDILVTQLKPLDATKAHPYHVGDKTTLQTTRFHITDSEMHMQSPGNQTSELVVAISEFKFRSRRFVFFWFRYAICTFSFTTC